MENIYPLGRSEIRVQMTHVWIILTHAWVQKGGTPKKDPPTLIQAWIKMYRDNQNGSIFESKEWFPTLLVKILMLNSHIVYRNIYVPTFNAAIGLTKRI